jgi:hypothetical protein
MHPWDSEAIRRFRDDSARLRIIRGKAEAAKAKAAGVMPSVWQANYDAQTQSMLNQNEARRKAAEESAKNAADLTNRK